MENLQKEKWANLSIKNFERYKVSSFGRVQGLKNNFMKLSLTPDGYFRIGLSHQNPRKTKHFMVHQLVAITFIPNNKNLPIVNHKDGNKQNNNVNNLEWVNQKENSEHSSRVLNNRTKGTSVAEFSTDNKLLKIYESIKNASEETNTPRSTIGGQCARNLKTNQLTRWRYYNYDKKEKFEYNPLMMEEIKGYEGLYAIEKEGKIYNIKTKQYMNFKIQSGYYAVLLRKGKTRTTHLIHKLMAETYVPYTGTKDKENLIVNHKDGNKLNNHPDNLEWITYLENNNHSYQIGIKQTQKIAAIDEKDNIIAVFWKMAAVSYLSKINTSLSIACKNKQKTRLGYKWRYITEEEYNEHKDKVQPLYFKDKNITITAEQIKEENNKYKPSY